MDAVRGLRIVRDRMRRLGWTVVEIPGWETRGHGAPLEPVGAINHWTAGPKLGNAPSLNVVVNGRAGLRNALAHTYQDRSAVLYIVAARVVWHAGAGSWPGLAGNADCLGHEPECSGPGDWRPGQLELAHDLDLVQADVFRYHFGRIIDHYEWAPTRKVDRNDVGGQRWRTRLTSPPEEEDMPLTDAEIKKIAEAVWAEIQPDEKATYGRIVTTTLNEVKKARNTLSSIVISGAVSAAALADQLVDRIKARL